MVESREKAKALIMSGNVSVNGKKTDKPGYSVPIDSEISIKSSLPFVSRGGLKLKAALDHFNINVKDHTFLDIGASTGGFTDCLIQYGASRVIAVDVGYGQLHWKLRQDPRVAFLERTNARYLKPSDLNDSIDGAVIDVSFISLKLIIPPISGLLPENSLIIALIKPQFEAGKDQIGKGGVIRDTDLHDRVNEDIFRFAVSLGWTVNGLIPSPILGPKGNREFLMYLTR